MTRRKIEAAGLALAAMLLLIGGCSGQPLSTREKGTGSRSAVGRRYRRNRWRSSWSSGSRRGNRRRPRSGDRFRGRQRDAESRERKRAYAQSITVAAARTLNPAGRDSSFAETKRDGMRGSRNRRPGSSQKWNVLTPGPPHRDLGRYRPLTQYKDAMVVPLGVGLLYGLEQLHMEIPTRYRRARCR